VPEPISRNHQCMINPMTGVGRRGRAGRPSLGDRAIMTATLPVIVLRATDTAAADHGIDRTAVLTDIICFHYGRTDLMRHLPQQLLFETATDTTELNDEDRRIGPHVKVRPPRVVADMIELDYQQLGIERSTFLADIVCLHMGYPELIRDSGVQKEGLPLAM
jgi:hypothetical protein